jgi:hypothetical protein
MVLAAAPLGCSSQVQDADGADASQGAVTTWAVHRFAREGQGEKIGSLYLTDPAGGPPRSASVGRHGLRIVLDTAPQDPTGQDSGADDPAAEVRVVYSREGAADTRAFVAVAAPGEAGVYLGTVELGAPGDWRFRIRIVGGVGGSALLTVADR